MKRREFAASASFGIALLSGCVGRNDAIITPSTFQIRLENGTEKNVKLRVVSEIGEREIVVTEKMEPDTDLAFQKDLPTQYPWSEPIVQINAEAEIGDKTLSATDKWAIEGQCDAGTFVSVQMLGDKPTVKVAPRCIP